MAGGGGGFTSNEETNAYCAHFKASYYSEDNKKASLEKMPGYHAYATGTIYCAECEHILKFVRSYVACSVGKSIIFYTFAHSKIHAILTFYQFCSFVMNCDKSYSSSYCLWSHRSGNDSNRVRIPVVEGSLLPAVGFPDGLFENKSRS